MPQTIPEVNVNSLGLPEEGDALGESQSHVEVTDVLQEPEPRPVVVKNEPYDAMRNEPLLSNVLVDIYDGETDEQGFLHGFGMAHFQGGNVYTGQFERGLMHGKGKYIWSDKTVYEGNFVGNQLCGHGVYIWPDGSVYEGEVKDGLRHGEGTFKCSSIPCTYSGMWCNGTREGQGCLKYDKDGISYYDGSWRENRRHGFGTRRYATGNVYEGNWKENVRHGKGAMHWYTTNEKYCGRWLNGVQHGYGEHTWFLRRIKGSQYPLRNRYVGGWVNGLRYGRGIFYYANGAKYNGEWVNNMKHGKGTFVFKNGMVFKGLFDSDHMLEFPDINPSGMITPDITSAGLPVRPGTPASSILSTDWTTGLELNIACLFDDRDIDLDQREAEMQHVNYVMLQHISKLKEIYTFYSAIGSDTSLDNTSVMTTMQFCRFLKDCQVHYHDISLPEILRLTAKEESKENPHHPWKNILLRDFLTALVTIAYHVFSNDHYSDDQPLLPLCLSKLIMLNVLPHACCVKGIIYTKPNAALELTQYFQKSYSIFQQWAHLSELPPHDHSFGMRQMLWMLKDCNLINQDLPAKEVINVLACDDPRVVQDEFINLEFEISFLEFFEALVGCATVYVTDGLLKNSPTPRQSTMTSSQSRSVRSHVSTVSMRPLETPDTDSRLSSHSLLNTSGDRQNGDNSPTVEQNVRTESPSKKTEIPILCIQASSADDPKHLSVEDIVVQETGKGQGEGEGDDNLTESQDFTSKPDDNIVVDNQSTGNEEAVLEEDFGQWCLKMNYFFNKTFFPAVDKLELLKNIAKRDA